MHDFIEIFFSFAERIFCSIALILYIPDPGKFLPVDSFYPPGLYFPRNRKIGCRDWRPG